MATATTRRTVLQTAAATATSAALFVRGAHAGPQTTVAFS